MVSITDTFLRHLNLIALCVIDWICILRLSGVGHLFAEVTDGRNYKERTENEEEMNNNVIKFI